MSAITQCPQCSTRFKVSPEQLHAHQGLVRCGVCQHVFDATQHLHDGQPSPQLDLLMAPEAAPPVHHSTLAPLAPVRHSARVENEKNYAESERKRNWPWVAGSLLVTLVLLAQAAYFFRVQLAAHQPSIKPLLISYCRLLNCSVPLPQKADLMSIDSSDIEADPVQTSVITFNATLRNRASYAQGYPDLELTLTDTQDQPMARRTFRPTDYLPPDLDEKPGAFPGREINIKLHLDTADLKPSGYRLLLFYR